MTDIAASAHQLSDDATDLDLIARWKSGDERAATALVERHADAIARFAASVGAREDVEDLVQETFVRAFGSFDSFRGESSLRTWLFTIARRLLLDRRRSERRRGGGSRMALDVKDSDAVTEYDALDAVVADETQHRMRDGGGSADADAAGSVHPSRLGRVVVQGDRRRSRTRRRARRGCTITTRCARSRSFSMTDCPNGDIRDLLPDLLNGRLAPAQRAEVEAHLLTCGDCNAELELLRAMQRSMHRAPAVAVTDIVNALPAYRAPARRLGNGWRIAAALALLAGGGTSIVVARDARVLDSHRAQVAVAPTVPSTPVTSTDTQVASTETPATVREPSNDAAATRAASAPQELAVASTTVGDLSEAELDALVKDLGSLDAVTPADVEQPASVSPIPPSNSSGAGA